MIQLTPQTRVFLALEAVDFRAGIDGLAQVCRQRLKEEPMSGALFVFRNRSGTGVKILVYDGQGFWMCYKRLSAGKFRYWPKEGQAPVQKLRALELMVLLGSGNPLGIDAAPDWHPVN
jgi:transposase